QIGVDDRLHAPAWSVCECEPRAYPHGERAGERAKGRLEQAVLVAEVMGDKPRGHCRATRDFRKSRADVADFSQTINGDVDQLGAPRFFALIAKRPIRGTAARLPSRG